MMRFLLKLSGVIFILWFIPWVWSLHLGFLIYFPYEPDGKTRYVRVTGPLLGFLDDDVWAFGQDIPKTCKAALIAAEDGRFYEHHGIDIEGIENAVERNEKSGKRRFGASTITQQLVKNAYLSRTRSYVRKSREIMGAVMLDVVMSKESQLAWYFNVVEFGPNIYGLTAAANYYFHKKPSALSQKECVQLVALLPSPNRSGRYLKMNIASKAMERRSMHIMRALSANF